MSCSNPDTVMVILACLVAVGMALSIYLEIRIRLQQMERNATAARLAALEASRASGCPICGGTLTPSTGPGRTRRYRGAPVEMPADLTFPQCESCGAEWLMASQLDSLSEAFERQRRGGAR